MVYCKYANLTGSICVAYTLIDSERTRYVINKYWKLCSFSCKYQINIVFFRLHSCSCLPSLLAARFAALLPPSTPAEVFQRLFGFAVNTRFESFHARSVTVYYSPVLLNTILPVSTNQYSLLIPFIKPALLIVSQPFLITWRKKQNYLTSFCKKFSL